MGSDFDLEKKSFRGKTVSNTIHLIMFYNIFHLLSDLEGRGELMVMKQSLDLIFKNNKLVYIN